MTIRDLLKSKAISNLDIELLVFDNYGWIYTADIHNLWCSKGKVCAISLLKEYKWQSYMKRSHHGKYVPVIAMDYESNGVTYKAIQSNYGWSFMNKGKFVRKSRKCPWGYSHKLLLEKL